MSDDLPRLQDAMLDEATLDALFTDLAEQAEVHSIVLKAGPAAYASGATPTLAEARDALRARAVFGVQLRYRHAGQDWSDTLMVTPDGVRLLRMNHTEAGM